MITVFKDIDLLSHPDFEIFIKDLLLASGWSQAIITKVGREYKYGDGGVDIFAYKGDRKFAIEVKQRNIKLKVDVSALNQLVSGAKLAKVKYQILVTNSYFTSEVKIRALRLGVELIDRDQLQNLWIMKHSEIGRKITPRKYQQKVIDDVIKSYNSGKSKLLIEMATGLGKTYTVAYIIKNLVQNIKEKPSILFLAHQVEIILQSATAFKNILGIGTYSFSACFSGATPSKTDFVFATFDTLYGQLNALKSNSFDFIIIDEAHHTPARTYAEVSTYFTPKLLIGLTATPYRLDQKNVLDFFGGEDGHIGRFDLIWALKNKKLAFPRYLVMLDDLSQEKINQLKQGLTISDIDRNLFLHKKDEEIVRIIEKTVVEKNIKHVKGIVFCRSVNHIKHLITFFKLGSATFIYSKMSDQEKRNNIRSFREGNYKYILVCNLFNEGIDIPETNLLIFVRYTGSRTIWLQQLGRGLRKTPDKKFVYVLDFVGSLDRLKEIDEFSKEVNGQIQDPAPAKEKLREFHDDSIEVNYSEEAATVFELLENLKLLLYSQNQLIEKLRNYYEKYNSIPSIHELDQKIKELSYDQIATHFGSYYRYLKATFRSNINQEIISTKIKDFISDFLKKHSIYPSLKTIALNFMVKTLYLFDEKDIKKIVPEIESLIRSETSKASNKSFLEPIKTEVSNTCSIIQKYKDKINKRSDVKKLDIKEQEEIKASYSSISVFLKKLKEAQNV